MIKSEFEYLLDSQNNENIDDDLILKRDYTGIFYSFAFFNHHCYNIIITMIAANMKLDSSSSRVRVDF